jgi:hypothetical protein
MPTSTQLRAIAGAVMQEAADMVKNGTSVRQGEVREGEAREISKDMYRL